RASKLISRCVYGTTSGYKSGQQRTNASRWVQRIPGSSGLRSGLFKKSGQAAVRIESGGTGCKSACAGRFVQAWLVFKKQESDITPCQQKR
ncbi:hypothetical protein C1H46_040759, partial [Malus baccata]